MFRAEFHPMFVSKYPEILRVLGFWARTRGTSYIFAWAMGAFRAGPRCTIRSFGMTSVQGIWMTAVVEVRLMVRCSHLKPGYGHFEQVEIDFRPRCDDGTLPYQPVGRWYDYLEGATVLAARSIRYQENTKQLLEAQGFVDIHTQIIQLPLNSWPSDPHLKMIGRWYNLGLTEGLEAISLGPLTRAFRWPADTVRRMVGDVKSTICNERHHIYNNM